MAVRLSFLGAAQNVTGSKYLLDTGKTRLLIDCGLYQERNLKKRNWEPFPFDPSSLDAVLLTHSHLDHCGMLPKLAKDGFDGPIHCTDAAADIAKIILLDSAHIQEEDIAFKRRRHEKQGRQGPYPYEPLYTTEDAEAVLSHFTPVNYGKTIAVGEGVRCTWHDAGHILGSAFLEIQVDTDDGQRTIVFSGDLGRCNTPILRDPAAIATADYVVVESTYGNRVHKDNSGIPDTLARVINQTHRAGGNVVVPSFAVERAQELLYHMHELLKTKRIPRLPVYLDSPMAVRVTEVFLRNTDLFDEETTAMLRRGEHPCEFPRLELCRTVEQSKAIQRSKEPAVIIAGSGMCTGGRIKHHLKANISRRESTVLFVGYQANGTLGRIILNGADEVRLHGETYTVDARVEKVNGFSAHADRNEIVTWLSGMPHPPKMCFVTHGEVESARAFGQYAGLKLKWPTTVPEYGDTAELA